MSANVTIQFYINQVWTPISATTTSACYDLATAAGATKARDDGWLAIYLHQEWVYLAQIDKNKPQEQN
jgi:hypothetical protein